MNSSLKKLLFVPRSIAIAACLFAVSAQAVELLDDGGFEFASGLPGWTLEESVYDQVTMMPRNFGDVNSAQQQGFGPQSGDFALWLRAFVGGESAGPDTATNAALSQAVPVNAGDEYTFSGWSRWEANYSGGFNTLNPGGPLGGVASPTTNTMELAFLDSSGSVVGTPTQLDLRTEQNNFDFWREHVLVATAPVGAVSARVSADAMAMVWNGGGSESAFYDNFSLRGAGDPMTELLVNNDLEDEPFEFSPQWTITEVPGGNLPDDPTVETRDFANRPNSGGQLGVWLKSFTGNETQPSDAIISQTVPGVPGGDYTFSGWSNFQMNYSGGDSAFDTETFLELAFLDGSGAEIGSPIMLDLIADGQSNGAGWMEHTINGIAPVGTANVRVTGAALMMETNPAGGQQSAFFDDFSLDGPGNEVLCDFDNDGSCEIDDIDMLVAEIASGNDNSDFDLTGDGAVNLDDRDEWLSQAGAMNLASGNSYLIGDATLDGVVDGLDFIDWNSNKFTSVAAWSAGDFNADGVVDGLDFIEWNSNKFTSADSAVAVPEASASILLLLGLLSWTCGRDRIRA